MIPTLLILQVLLPLALLTWLAVRPLRSRVGLAAQLATTGLLLLLLWRSGVWIVPPWWMILVYAALFVLTAAKVVKNVVLWPWLPTRWGLAGTALFLATACYVTLELSSTVAATRPPGAGTVSLQFPLRGSTFLILNGGSNLSTSAHADALDQSVPAHRPYWGTSYGVDFVAVNAWGLRATGIQPRAVNDYFIYGLPVVSPCDGRVIKAADGAPDMTPPQYDLANLEGNRVILACGDAHILLAHFRPDSVAVREGEVVVTGQRVGAVGNSGGTDEPHLHIHAQRPGTPEQPFSGEPLGMLFEGRFLVRGDIWRAP